MANSPRSAARRQSIFGLALPPYAYNFAVSNLTTIKAKLTATAAGGGYTKIACLGDSKTAGAGSGTVNGSNIAMQGAFTLSYPGRLAAGLPANRRAIYEGYFGDHNAQPLGGIAALAQYYGNVAFSGTWDRPNLATIGGGVFRSAANGDTMTITPRSPVNTIDVYIFRVSSNTVVTASDSSGTIGTINIPGGAAAVIKTTISRATASIDPIVFTTTTTTNFVVYCGLEMWNSGLSQTRVLNLGAYGTVASVQASSAALYSPMPVLKQIAPDLTIINLGTNDITGSVAVASYQADLTTIVQAAKLSGDVILVWPSAGSNVTPATRAPYRAAMLAVAAANNCVMMDWTELMIALGGRNADNTAGPNDATYFFDFNHETAAGYQAEANTLLPVLA